MVLISRASRSKVYEYLLSEGVLVVKKDFKIPIHEETGMKNLEVWMMMRSLTTKGHVEEIFNWGYLYYYVKTEGVAYLKECLGINNENVVPLTFKKDRKDYVRGGDDEGKRGERGDRPGRGRGGRGGRGGGVGRGAKRHNDGEEQPEVEKDAQVVEENFDENK